MALDFEYGGNTQQNISSEDFLTNEREARRQARIEKNRRKHYKFTDKEHSRTGIASSVLALNALIFIIAAVVLSTIYHGAGNILVGVLGAISFLSSSAGVVCGLVSFRNTDVLLKFAWMGLIASGILWLIMGVLIVFGI